MDVTILIDNFTDIFLQSSAEVRRAPLSWNWSERDQLIAEHGYSILVSLHRGGEERTLLYDAGLGRQTLNHNLKVLGLNAEKVEAIAMSHGHADHHGGLEGLAQLIGKRNLPLIIHPDAWQDRKIIFPSGNEIHLPPINRKMLEDQGVKVVDEKAPSLLLGETALVSGQVERTTTFEKGFPIHYANHDGGWEKDPMVYDDQGIICNVKDRGLVVVSSCSHAGVVNVLRNAKRLTGENHVHAFIGGLHLSGSIFDPLIQPTLEELVKIGPDFIVPGHCTGWKATHEIARKMPQSYVQTGVGTQLHFA